MLNKTFWITVTIVAIAVIAVLSILPTPNMGASQTDGDNSFGGEGVVTFDGEYLPLMTDAQIGDRVMT